MTRIEIQVLSLENMKTSEKPLNSTITWNVEKMK